MTDGTLCVDNLSGTMTVNPDNQTGTLALTLTFVSSANSSIESDCGDTDTFTLGVAADRGGNYYRSCWETSIRTEPVLSGIRSPRCMA